MIGQFSLSLILPCCNEEEGLRRLLPQVPAFVDQVIVVDNASTDKTAQVAADYRFRVVGESRKGYGSALLKGLRESNGQILAIIDADGSYPVTMLKEICAFMQREDLDFVSGCRFPLSDPKAMPFVNLISNYFISFLSRSFFKIPLRDSQSGMMVFKSRVMEKIQLRNIGMGFSQEIKIKAWTCPGIRCGEYRISYFPRFGKVKFRKLRDGLGNFFDLLSLRKELLV